MTRAQQDRLNVIADIAAGRDLVQQLRDAADYLEEQLDAWEREHPEE